MKPELKDYQVRAIKFALDVPKTALFLPTGCLSGSTLIPINRGKRGFKIRLDRLYNQYYKRDKLGDIRFDLSISTYVRSFSKDVIRLNKMIDVKYSGKKLIYLLSLENECCIKATDNHKIMTQNGYKELIQLNSNDFVMCDNACYQKSNVKAQKLFTTDIKGTRFHPHKRRVKTDKRHSIDSYNYFNYRITLPRAVYEAHINNLTLDEYKYIIRHDEKKARKLKYLDSNMHIHHEDGNHYNNVFENLAVTDLFNHGKLHGDDYYKNFGMGLPNFSRVKSITKLDYEDTYDICCLSPNNNFVANNIVVHNSGKTLVSLLYIKVLDKSTIIITPASVRHVWLDENKKFDIGLHISTDYREGGKITIISYDTIKNSPEIMKDYEIIVLDEAHCISDSETVRYKQLSPIIKSKERVLLLAGYPVENKLNEIYMLSLITDVLGKNYYHFLGKFFHVIRHNGRIIKTVPKAGSFEKIVELIRPFVFIVDKSEAVPKEIKKETVVVRYALSDYQKNIINALSEFGEFSDKNIHVTCKNALVAFGKVMQVISGFIYHTNDMSELYPVYFDTNPKLEALRKVVKDRDNYLLWHVFDAEFDIIKEFDSRCRLSKLQTDSRGLNLQEYDFAVYYSVPLSGGMYYQSQDRLYRLGRTKNVLSIVLIPEGDFGDRLLQMLDRKFKLTKSFINELLRTKA